MRKATRGSKVHESSGLRVTKLISQAVSASRERRGLCLLAALKKALAAGGYDVERNNSCIKLGLKSLLSKGVLVQTKGTGASGSFKFSKKPDESKEKVPKKKPASKSKIPAAKKPRKAAIVKKNAKKSKTPAASAAKSPKVKTLTPKNALRGSAKAVKAKCVNPTEPKAKAAAPKK